MKPKNDLYERYERMENIAGNNEISSDFRECIGEWFGDKLKQEKGNMTLSEFLEDIEEWFKTWGENN